MVSPEGRSGRADRGHSLCVVTAGPAQAEAQPRWGDKLHSPERQGVRSLQAPETRVQKAWAAHIGVAWTTACHLFIPTGQPSGWSAECNQALPMASPAPTPVTDPQRLQHIPQALYPHPYHIPPPQPPAGGGLTCHPALPSTPSPCGSTPISPLPSHHPWPPHRGHFPGWTAREEGAGRGADLGDTGPFPQWLAGLSPLPPHRSLAAW